MRTLPHRFQTSAIAAVLLLAPTALAGDVDPPPGSIAPSMISLEDIAGRCVNDLPGDATAVHVITEPGNYYLCDDVTCAVGTSGVAISLDGLPPGTYAFALNLNGHTIQGVPGSLHGIHARPSAASESHITLVDLFDNGARGGGGISDSGADGIRLESASSVYIFSTTVTDATGNGITVTGGTTRECTIEDLSVSNAGGDAVSVEGAFGVFTALRLINPEVTGSGGNGVTITNFQDCTLSGVSTSDNTGHGVSATAPPDQVTILVIDDLTATNNGLSGVNGEDFRDYQFSGVSSAGNAAHGVHVVVDSPPAALPGEPVQGVNISIGQEVGGVFTGNGGSGVLVTTTNFPAALPGEPVKGVNVTIGQEVGGVFTGNGDDGVTIECDASVVPRVTLRNVSTNNNARHGVHTRPLAAGAYCDVRVRDADASGNIVNGLDLTGNVEIDRATCTSNGGNGIDHTMSGNTSLYLRIAGETVCSTNGADGVNVLIEANAGNATVVVTDVVTNGNTLQGFRLTDDSADPVSVELGGCSATNNGTGGITVDVTTPAALKKRVRKRKCSAHANAGPGIVVLDASASIIQCSSTSNTGHGYALAGESFILDASTSQDNTGDGLNVIADAVRISECTSTNNGGDGLDLAPGNVAVEYVILVSDPSSHANGGHGILVADGNLTVQGGAVSNNGLDGIHVDNTGAAHVVRCQDTQCRANIGGGVVVTGGSTELHRVSASENGSHGIDLMGGDDRVIFQGAPSCNNGGDGIRVLDLAGTLTIEGAVTSGNTGSGITVTASGGTSVIAAEIQRCVSHANGTNGISVSSTISGRVVDCSAFSNGSTGIELLSFAHVMTNNMCGNNGAGNYSVLLPGNAVGSLVDETNIDTEDNTTANYAP